MQSESPLILSGVLKEDSVLGPVAKREAAKHGVTGDDADKDPGRSRKRRRRAFSCLSCQKLKCRCEYDLGAPGCHRCQTLRIDCSLRGESVTSPARQNVENRGGSVEERLQRHEDALQEIKNMLQALQAQGLSPKSGSSEAPRGSEIRDDRSRQAAEEDHDGPECISNPADKGIKSAPVVVLREISEVANRGYRRLLEHLSLDLVHLHLLDEQTIDELLDLFIRHQSHSLLACSKEDLLRKGNSRQVSAFLHNTCCLMGIVYRPDICGSTVHRQVYEQVRITLGQALLTSPLNLEEINAVLIMSDNANTPSSNGAEYVDSWLLTGYCAKQAMLSISFSKIVNNIKQGSPTVEDHRAIHLWSTICLHHLHWAATTGRPSIIPRSYVNQCNILMSFYQATMQDGMLVAEISLYLLLHQKLGGQSYPGDGSECEEFVAWKQKWSHLLSLPTSSMLQIGYHAACLILALRTLEESGHVLGTKSLLSSAVGSPSHSSFPPTSTAHREPPSPSSHDAAAAQLRTHACAHARAILQTFLAAPAHVRDATPTSTCLCIGYCALALAHYDAGASGVPDAVSLALITQVDAWVRTAPGKSWAYKYNTLARRKVEARVGRRSAAEEEAAGAVQDGVGVEYGGGGHSDEDASATLPAGFDLGDQAVFPSMEDFFGGGFLDFMR
ncbi:hypothetical protein F4780DRAFT_753370 [Xylariomycetidae sp. FL0641]|nr:hypothetical protein F4780DRAFT_753370 [Xylariomycetidae sp. FL0641]